MTNNQEPTERASRWSIPPAAVGSDSFQYYVMVAVWIAALFLAFGSCHSGSHDWGGKREGAASELNLPFSGRSIEAFIGSASKPATEEAAKLFEQQTGARVVMHFGGSGQMLAQIRLSRRGDLYFPGSSDYMELAIREGLAVAESEQRIVYLVPAINVPIGNPKGIQTLADLAQPGMRVGIARPDAVCVGLYAVELLNKSGWEDQVRPRIVTQAESCEKTAQLVALGSVDAVIGWRVFHYWDPEKIDTILLPPDQISRIGYIPIAKTPFVQDHELAEAFIEFLLSDEGKGVFRKWHYLTDLEAARAFAEPDTPVGGQWKLPDGW